MKEAKVKPKKKLIYASWYFIREANTWWKMRIAIDKTQKAITWEQFQNVLLQSRLVIRDQKKTSEDTKKYCRICGEGHLTEEHNDQCPNCEGNHPAEECPTINVTCFLCEGTDHCPVQCKIFLEVQRKVQQSKERKQVTPEEAS